jgi:hypothetical protein
MRLIAYSVSTMLCAYETTMSHLLLGAVEVEYEVRCKRGADQRRRCKGEMRKGDGGLT